MVAMPYHLETAPNLEVLEDFVNGSTVRLVKALRELRAGVPVCDIGPLDSRTLDAGPYSKAQRHAQLMGEWFGMAPGPKNTWKPQPAFDPATNPTTGYWEGWYGDAEGIVRQTMIRAAEVALGLDHDQAIGPRSKPPRHWPIQFLWKCSQPWLEGWVTWRTAGVVPSGLGATVGGKPARRPRAVGVASGGGLVTVVFCSPGNGDPVLTTPLSPPQSGAPDYRVDPVTAPPEGIWVITHEREDVVQAATTAPSPSGAWNLPSWGPVYVGRGKVVTVAPAEPGGGVLATGRAWIP